MTNDQIEELARALCEADCGRITENELARCEELAKTLATIIDRWISEALELGAQQEREAAVDWLRGRASIKLPGENAKLVAQAGAVFTVVANSIASGAHRQEG